LCFCPHACTLFPTAGTTVAESRKRLVGCGKGGADEVGNGLWPHYNQVDANENDNSVVLTLKYGNSSAVLTGDAEEVVWNAVKTSIPQDTAFFKVPHHGSRNGSLDAQGQPTWLPSCPAAASLGISCMYRKDYKHPHESVLTAFSDNNRQYYRTDEHYHLTVSLDGTNPPDVKYSHV
jgi:beta-lactamase superfamily II metal-dependent hydrolase